MKEELITFETAKLAKQKGFDIPTYYGYRVTTTPDGTPTKPILCTGHEELGVRYENYNFNLVWKDTYGTSAPTQSLLQKWLWETHKLFLSISGVFYISGGPKCDGFKVYINDLNEGTTYSYPEIRGKLLENPEQALEKGLQEALKLI